MNEHDYRLVTITMAQTILDCATYSQNDRQMVSDVARDAGLLPLKPADKSILKEGLGNERFNRFVRLCSKD